MAPRSRSAPDHARTLLLLCSAVLLGLTAARLLYRPAASEGAEDLLRLLDQDGDGGLSPAEYARVAGDELPFQILDLDRSGALEAQEIEAAVEWISPLRASLSFVARVR